MQGSFLRYVVDVKNCRPPDLSGQVPGAASRRMENLEIPKGISTVPTAPATTGETATFADLPITGKGRSPPKIA
jgi:hypothetical protein